MEKTWSIYLIRCGDGSLYCGITVNVETRLEAHKSGQGAKYTRGRSPLVLVYTEEVGTHSEALKRERAIKKLSKKQKELIVEGKNEPNSENLCDSNSR